MTWWEILIIIAAAGFVVAVAAFSIRRKLQGKSSCDGCNGCNGCCTGCSMCHPKKTDEHRKEG